MDCASCVAHVEKAASTVPGVQACSVNLARARAVVQFDPHQTTAEKIAEAISDSGYPAAPEVTSAANVEEQRVAHQEAHARAWFWRAVAIGGTVLASAVVFLGVFVAVAFDPAFELFHRLFFPAGSYDFDPATARLVQLFPEAFWYQTSVAFGVVLVGLSLGVALFALRRVRRLSDARPGRDAAGAATGSSEALRS